MISAIPCKKRTPVSGSCRPFANFLILYKNHPLLLIVMYLLYLYARQEWKRQTWNSLNISVQGNYPLESYIYIQDIHFFFVIVHQMVAIYIYTLWIVADWNISTSIQGVCTGAPFKSSKALDLHASAPCTNVLFHMKKNPNKQKQKEQYWQNFLEIAV